MSANDTYLAVFLGSKTSSRMKAWIALPETERRAKEQEGMAAWKAWAEKHRRRFPPWADRSARRRRLPDAASRT
jgi:hypothetical protein